MADLAYGQCCARLAPEISRFRDLVAGADFATPVVVS